MPCAQCALQMHHRRLAVLIAVLAIPAAVLFGLIYLVWTVSDAVTGRLERRTE